MIRKSIIDLSVAFNNLRCSALVGASNLLVAVILGTIIALKNKELLAVTHTLQVGHRKRRFTHREVVDRVDDICLAGAIIADKAVKTLVEQKFLLCEVLEIE
jgi:hypothetical protein